MSEITPEEISHCLVPATEIEIPLPNCPVTRLLAQEIGREWCMFLWRRDLSKAPKILLRFIAEGQDIRDFYSPRNLRIQMSRTIDWIPKGRDLFLNSANARFWNFRLMGSIERPRHWRMGQSDNLKKGPPKKGESNFLDKWTMNDIQRGLWLGMAILFDEFRDQHLRFVDVQFKEVMGISRGAETTAVRYDIDQLNGHAHAYPISQREYGKYPTVTLDESGFANSEIFAAAAAA